MAAFPKNDVHCTALVPATAWALKLLAEGEFENDIQANGELPEEVVTQLRKQAEHYPPGFLEPDSRQIRLLRVLPDEWQNDMRCETQVFNLRDRPEYEVLSYTWGRSLEERRIVLNGKPGFPVTDNAFAALRRFRYPNLARIIWIDAICINQSNLEERLQQVSIMGDIYSSAKQCLVWLGETEHGPAISVSGRTVGQPRHDSSKGSLEALEALDFIYWHAKPHWWDRAWTFQEAVLPSLVVVCWGPYQLVFGDFCWDMLRVDSPERSERTGLKAYPGQGVSQSAYPIRESMQRRFIGIARRRHNYRKEGYQALQELVGITKDRECSDNRDRLYSVLSLMDPREASLLQPSYKRPWMDALARGTYASIKTQKSFGIWTYLTHRYTGYAGMPSWALDFNKMVDGDDYKTLNVAGVSPQLKKGTKGWTHVLLDEVFAVHLARAATLLMVAGIRFDAIREVIRLPNFTLSNDTMTPNIGELIAKLLEDSNASDAYESVLHEKLHMLSPKNEDRDVPEIKARIDALRECDALDGFAYPNVAQGVAAAFHTWSTMARVSNRLRDRSSPDRSGFIDVNRFWAYSQAAGDEVVLFTTSSGFIGLAPYNAHEPALFGPLVVALLHGSHLPVVLLPSGAGEYNFRGFAYVHGIMCDELKELGTCDALTTRWFRLV